MTGDRIVKGLFGGLTIGAFVAVATVPASADMAMTPVRLPSKPGAAQQFVEPPPAFPGAKADAKAPALPAAEGEPVATAPIPPLSSAAGVRSASAALEGDATDAKGPETSSVAPAAHEPRPARPAAAEAEPSATQPEEARSSHSSQRAAARKRARHRTAAGRLNRGEMGRIRGGVPSYATSYPYYGAGWYAPSPHADTGD